MSKKSAFWVPFWEHLGDNIVEIGVKMSSKKSSEAAKCVFVERVFTCFADNICWGGRVFSCENACAS